MAVLVVARRFLLLCFSIQVATPVSAGTEDEGVHTLRRAAQRAALLGAQVLLRHLYQRIVPGITTHVSADNDGNDSPPDPLEQPSAGADSLSDGQSPSLPQGFLASGPAGSASSTGTSSTAQPTAPQPVGTSSFSPGNCNFQPHTGSEIMWAVEDLRWLLSEGIDPNAAPSSSSGGAALGSTPPLGVDPDEAVHNPEAGDPEPAVDPEPAAHESPSGPEVDHSSDNDLQTHR